MLAAMPTAPDQQVPPGTGRPRGRDDACPGALRLHAADDGALARIRIPGGVLTAGQAAALGTAAARLGDGEVHLTSRGNAQLRGLGASCGAELERLLTAAELLPSAAHERVRNIVASPLSGLDGRGHFDVRRWLFALDGLLCASAPARALSGRFLFALDDGRGDMAALAADVTLRAAPAGPDGPTGFALLGVGRNTPVRVPADAAVRAALLAAELFLAAAATGSAPPPAPTPSPGSAPPTGPVPVTAWRVADLPDGGAELSAEVARRLAASGIPVTSAAAPPVGGAVANSARAQASPAPGIVAHPQRALPVVALSVLAPLGRLTAEQWCALADLAGRTRDGELRLTPWRGAVIPGVAEADAQRELAALAATGLVTDGRSPWVGVGACVGRPGCARSLADVRADATAAVRAEAGAQRGDTGGGTGGAAYAHHDGEGRLPLYWSGCSRGCGRPRGDRVDVVATPDGYRVDVVRDGAVPTSAVTTGTVPIDPVPTGAVPTGSPSGTADLAATVAAARRGAVSR
jgi:precorrin-3B synthase